MATLGVGIIGVSPVRGWAATAHIPALRALPSYEIRALSAHNAESARAAGEAFGVSAVFADHEQLVTQPDIDLVVVTVKVPHHRALVSAALAAGKAVYCEWPLGRDLEDTRAMAALAAERGGAGVGRGPGGGGGGVGGPVGERARPPRHRPTTPPRRRGSLGLPFQ